MLETRNLCKIYRPKKGVPVKAVNNISLKFPDKGMIFLLGKSGSGKSTLLNLLGGLDKYDSGEIIIKGVSSKNFKQQHFDSYRNTYVGFIFQEYNVLEEFSVGANIALAIELQGRKASDDEINKILKEVDLEGYGNRKPNELSGGQKQRVAIARALVKNPEIIMADEPTGALDSNTGRQVLETLRKLSSNKLVIVVSHDREFAEQYADRIIELADGVVINDMVNSNECNQQESQGITFNDNAVSIARGYHLTEDDRKAINEYIDSLESGVQINIDRKSSSSKRFKATDQSSITSENKSEFALIKSKLPLKNAFKIGGSSLKHKKVRLVFTILLSFVAFTLFALADTFGAYNHVKTCTNSIMDSDITYASIVKSKKFGEGLGQYWRSSGYKLTDEEIEAISKDTGNTFKGVYVPLRYSLSIESNYDTSAKLNGGDNIFYIESFSGITEVTSKDLDSMGYKLVSGKLPDGSRDEIAISAFAYETFAKAKYSNGEETLNSKGQYEKKYETISGYNDMVGKTLTLGDKKYTVTGIVDTGFDANRYSSLLEDGSKDTTSQQLIKYLLASEMRYARNYSLTGSVMTGEGFVERLIKDEPKVVELSNSYLWLYSDNASVDGSMVARLSDTDTSKITWLDGAKTSLGDKEVVITSDCLSYYSDKGGDDYASYLSENNSFRMSYSKGGSDDISEDGYKIVGIIDTTEDNRNVRGGIMVLPDALFTSCTEDSTGTYTYAVSAMPKGKEEVKSLVSYCYNDSKDIRYDLQSSVTYELDTVNDVLKVFAKVFLYIGAGFAVFAALMLANFIGTSISYKKQEIGILRAIGSRSNDVFRIFFAESFMIAMINFILSCIGTFAATSIVNHVIRTQGGILITVLNFGIRQVALLLVISIGVAALASYIPVKKIASKRPIDAIRNR